MQRQLTPVFRNIAKLSKVNGNETYVCRRDRSAAFAVTFTYLTGRSESDTSSRVWLGSWHVL